MGAERGACGGRGKRLRARGDTTGWCGVRRDTRGRRGATRGRRGPRGEGNGGGLGVGWGSPPAHHGAGVPQVLRRQPQALRIQAVQPGLLPPLQPLGAVGPGVGAGTQHLWVPPRHPPYIQQPPDPPTFDPPPLPTRGGGGLRLAAAHLQQGVAGVLLEEGPGSFVPPRVRRAHLHLQLPQLLQAHGQIPPHGHQTLQVIQARVVVPVLLRPRTEEEE